MYRYELSVYLNEDIVFCGCFSSINKLVKVASNFDVHCELVATDIYFNNSLPIEDLIQEFTSPVI